MFSLFHFSSFLQNVIMITIKNAMVYGEGFLDLDFVNQKIKVTRSENDKMYIRIKKNYLSSFQTMSKMRHSYKILFYRIRI